MERQHATELSAPAFEQWLRSERLQAPGFPHQALVQVCTARLAPATTVRDPLLAAVVVGVDRCGALPAGWAEHADVLLTVVPDAPAPWVSVATEVLDATLAQLRATVECAPLAATTLVQVLRAGAGQPFTTALLLESLAYSTLLGGPEFAAWRTAHPARQREAQAAGTVTLQRTETELQVTLARPGARNALSAEVRQALALALQVGIADDTLQRIVLAGEGPAFCAGGDLDEFGSAADPASAHVIRLQQSACRAIDTMRHKVLARVHGACIGGGLEMAACAGRVEAAQDAFFRLPEVAMGLIPGAGGTASIPRRIGRHRTAWMAITGAPVDGRTALQWGLVDALRH